MTLPRAFLLSSPLSASTSRRPTRKDRRHSRVRLEVEHLEARELLSATALPAPATASVAVQPAAGTTGTTAGTITWNWATAYANGFPSTAGLALNGFGSAAPLAGTDLRLTDGGIWEARSAYLATPVSVQSFTTSFSFQITPGAGTGSGFTFVLQGDGPTALGNNGGGLGSEGMSKSVAVKFDIYDSAGEGPNSTGLYLNGASPRNVGAINLTPSGVDLHNGHVYNATLGYDGKNLAITLADASNAAAKFTQSWPVDIPGTVGGSTAYVGFTGATGTPVATQDISKWTYQAGSAPVAAIDAGGTAAGAFSADANFSGGSTYHVTNPIDTSNVSNPAPQAVYQSERYGNFTYTIPNMTAGGSYQVRLHFAEIYWTSVGKRLFNVSINGTQVLSRFDIFAQTGGEFKAIVEQFGAVADSSGDITIAFSAATGSPDQNAKVSGIEILPSQQQVAPPAAPTGVAAAAGNAQVTLTWTAAAGAVSYNVYRGTSAGGEATTPIATGVTNTSFVNTGLTNGTTYYYTAAAVNAGGVGDPSKEASATPQLPAPAAPTGLSAAAGSGQVALSWTAVAGAATYNLYRSTSAGAEMLLQAGITGTSYTNTGLTNGTAYYYKVAAVNAGGTSPLSGEVSATPQTATAPPAPPTNVTATPGRGEVIVTWTASPGATSYKVVRGPHTNGYLSVVLATGVTGTTFTDTTAPDGTANMYWVYADNAAGESWASGQVWATANTLVEPTNPAAQSGNGRVTLTWGNDDPRLISASNPVGHYGMMGATGYNVYRGTTPGGETLLAAGVTALTYTDSTAQNGTTYYYRITSVNANSESQRSVELMATPQNAAAGAPAAPTKVIPLVGNSQVTLQWTAVAGAATYNIYRGIRSNGESMVPIKTGVSGSSFNDTGLGNGTTYYYKVTAVNAEGQSAWSNEVFSTPNTAQTGWNTLTYKDAAGKVHYFYVFIPLNYNPAVPAPAVMFLHGLGESGDDTVYQGSRPGFTVVGLGTAIDARADTFPFIAVFTQSQPWAGYPQAMGELQQVEHTFNVDLKRVYLTGLSMGGIGTWDMAAAHPGVFAAIAIISGTPDNPATAPQFVNVPIWAFEGDEDQFFNGADAMDQQVNSLGGHEKFTQYYGVGHDGWENAYGEFTGGDTPGSVGGDELYAWFLEQRLP